MDYSATLQDNINSLSYFLPELILTGVILVLIVADLILKKERSPWTSFVALAGLIGAFVAVYQQYDLGTRSIFNNMLVVDPFALFFKLLFLASTILVIFLSIGSVELAGRQVGEYFTLIVATTLGMFLMASATNLLTIFISIEMVSITSFILAAYLKTRRRSSEAGLKYAIYGAFSSGLMLYGISLIYGLTGTLNIYEISEALAATNPDRLTLFVAVILILAGFGYKIAAVPFHFWAPDVYEGAPTPVTAFFSIGPKAAGFALLIRFFNVALVSSGTNGDASDWYAVTGLDWTHLLAVVSAATMTLGNLIAIVQRNVKRLLAYSSIAHAGYALMGVVVFSKEGIYATMFYLVVYYLMNLGAFLVVIVNQELVRSESIDDYKGLVWKAPIPAVAMGVFLFSLTGLPPTGGFVGKFYLFAALINGGQAYYWLAVVGILNSVVSLYYYARILKAMYFDKPEDEEVATGLTVSPYYVTLLAVLVIPTIMLGVYWAPLADLANFSVEFLKTL
ncbi:NADH-quinone oxidoreductase subunit N [candidate division KSB1 bacterium]|nr:NADH-quinone oxidoreductase subunit N [candidate division KSB1 bacterium]NIR73363.1 NADH-quinone oxidoreductase subunit N [candidate division KSB1 bacterium]NIS25243.1 NADH-quinone oxidoreductase subunit N [candidate division KSB1 bacterium]NIT72146.1 NADH-quinone oxidoreductase subunit N [candidate division KSB1 bacterium]NIU25952.1 NADH-quinone oxidoreductase subunit N [candidate division KSB1 bacterium]